MKPRLIGITGHKGSGKNTVADFLSHYGYAQDAFAAPLKDAVQRIFTFTDAQVYGEEKEVVDMDWGLTPRFVLQRFGTEVARSIHKDVWARSLVLRWHVQGKRAMAVTDVRFLHEAAAIRDQGGVLIRVERAGYTGDGHASEQEQRQIQVDYTIFNNSSLSDLRHRIRNIVAGWEPDE